MAFVYRFAPSPNGYLHLGHAFCALLNQVRARATGGKLLVRIEDIDTVRCTAELGHAALQDLAWLGVVSQGPVLWQSLRRAEYERALAALKSFGILYRCTCTRKMVTARARGDLRDPEGQPLYDGACKRLAPPEGVPAAWRVDMAALASRFPDAARWGDLVIARRDIGTSYHLSVVVDDAAQGITHIVRGCDLEAATPVHHMLQTLLGLAHPHYEHHRLVENQPGEKLSKSAGHTSLRQWRERGATASDVRQACGFL